MALIKTCLCDLILKITNIKIYLLSLGFLHVTSQVIINMCNIEDIGTGNSMLKTRSKLIL